MTLSLNTFKKNSRQWIELLKIGWYAFRHRSSSPIFVSVAGTPPSPNYTYFSGSATDQGHGGAMHNHSYLHHEPGGYAHNRFYAKRLIFDSIDWLTNPTDGGPDAAGSRTLDGAIFLDPATYEAAIIWLGGDPATGIIDSRP